MYDQLDSNLAKLRSPKPIDRFMAVRAVHRVVEDVVANISKLLEDEDNDVTDATAIAICSIRAELNLTTLRVLPVLIRTLDHPDGERRASAARALSALGSQASAAIPALTAEQLVDTFSGARTAAHEALTEIVDELIHAKSALGTAEDAADDSGGSYA